MRRSVLAVLSLGLVLALAPDARAMLAPNGDTVWNLVAGPYQITLQLAPGNALGPMTMVDTLSGRSAVGLLYPAGVHDRPHGELDDMVADGYFESEVFYPFLGLGEVVPGAVPPRA